MKMFGHRELYRECTTPVPVSLRLVEHCLDAEITQTENLRPSFRLYSLHYGVSVRQSLSLQV